MSYLLLVIGLRPSFHNCQFQMIDFYPGLSQSNEAAYRVIVVYTFVREFI